MAKITLAPKIKQGSVKLDDISDEFISEFEEVYTALKGQPDLEVRVECDNESEAKTWAANAKSYGEQRMDENGDHDPLIVRKLPKRGLPKTISYFSIQPLTPTDDESK